MVTVLNGGSKQIGGPMKPVLLFYFIIRIIGWIFGIAAVYARFTDYSGYLGYVFDACNVKFYLLGTAFLELMYQHMKLYYETRELIK